MTAVEFAEKMGVDRTTVLRWLRLKLVPGAVKETSPRGDYWQIPQAALKMERPLPGRKRQPKADE